MTTLPGTRPALAVEGAPPTRSTPVPGWPVFGPAEIAAAVEVLDSGRVNYWTGEQGRRFEEEFAAWSGAAHAVAMANGTVALEIALRALGVGPGDEVVVPAATFIATASAVAACGARPVVVDVDPETQALTAATVEPVLGARTAAVVLVHVGGYPAATDELLGLLGRYGIHLVEDCAQAHGAVRAGRGVGRSGRLAAWSFCQDKIITTGGEGGAVTTDDPVLARRCWELKDHGKNRVATLLTEHPPGFRWLHDSFGTNARMTEVSAAIGRSQLTLVDGWVARRRRNAAALRTALDPFPAIRTAHPPAGVDPSWYRFYGHLDPALLRAGWDRDRIVAAIAAEGVPCSVGGCTEIYRERAFDGPGRPADLPVARTLGATSLVLPVHPTLGDEEIADVAAAAVKVLAVASL